MISISLFVINNSYDDDLRYYSTLTYDANGKLKQSISFGAAGADGKWFTADDEISFISEFGTGY